MTDDTEIIEDAEVLDADEPGTDLALPDDEVVEGEPDPELEAAQIADELREATQQVTALTQELVGLTVDPGVETGTALVPSTQTAAAAKQRLASLRAGAMKQAQQIERKQAEVVAAQKRAQALMERQVRLAMEKLAPLEKFVARLQEGIWMVNLYLGRDEEIVTLYDGEPADADEMITVRQLVLAMDEESAVHADEGGIDATSIEEFDKWLLADFAHVEQIAPEQKCVVALRPRFRDKDYGDAWKNAAVHEANQQTYFLIRNGGRIYRTWTEFNVGDRLVPTADEFSSFFYQDEFGRTPSRDRSFLSSKHRIPITPGTPAWERAEEAADARQRHYMRVALILQGLVDRTTVFHPLPESGVSFMDFEQNGRSWRFLMDAEMALTTGRQPFYEWLREKNSNLQVGMRIVGRFVKTYNRDYDEWAGRIWPKNAELPPSGKLLTIEEEQSGGWVVRYERTEEIYDARTWVPSENRPGWGHRGVYRKPKQRASAVLSADDKNIIPFDLVTVEEMEGYLAARLERHAYTTMFPLLKRAIQAKHEEAAEEAPFRVMLAGVLARENGVEVAEAEADVPSLVEWYKLANKQHRPLVGTEAEQAKAVRLIVGEHARRVKSRGASSTAVEAARALHPDALLVARKRDGKYVVLVPENDRNVFVREMVYGARALTVETTGSIAPVEDKRWVLMPPTNRRVRWHVAYQAERFDSWEFNASLDDYLTDPEFERLAAEAVERARRERIVAAVAYDTRDGKSKFRVWSFDQDEQEGHQWRGPYYRVEQFGWHRVNRRATLRSLSHSSNVGWVDQVAPWDTRTKDGKPSQYRDVARNLYVVVYHDPKVEQAHDAYDAEVKQRHAEEAAFNAKVGGWLDSIKTAWEERNEAKLYADFLAEFLDPELWEGHRKTMKAKLFEYPYKHRRDRHGRAFREERDPVEALVSYAVEQAVDLDGLTVWEAATEHFPPLAWFGEPQSWRVSHGRGNDTTEYERFPEASDIPVDLRHLRFQAPKVAEEPDEDDDWDEED